MLNWRCCAQHANLVVTKHRKNKLKTWWQVKYLKLLSNTDYWDTAVDYRCIELCSDLHKHRYSLILPHQQIVSKVLLSKNLLSVGATRKNDNTPFVKVNQTTTPWANNILSKQNQTCAEASSATVPGWCIVSSLFLLLCVLSLLPHSSVQACWQQLFESSDFPLELLQAGLPGPQCVGSPFPTALSPAGPPVASAPSPAPGVQSSPGSAAP